MIATLFNDGLTADPGVTSMGAGKLVDCISCTVEREINGVYELTMQYPRDGQHYDQIGLRSLLYVKPDRRSGNQLFRIYKISKAIRNVVTIRARHISYDLAGYVCAPFTASTITAALSGITSNTQPTPCPFSFSSSRSTSANFTVGTPCDIWSLMAGQEGSLLDVYTGEYDFDNFGITLENSIGQSNGVVIEYGKNLTKLNQDEDEGDFYTGIYPYYYSDEDGLIELTEKVVDGSGSWSFDKYKAVDFTDRFESAPTEAQLRTAAQAYVTNNNIGVPKVSLEVDFVPLWQTVEFGGTEWDAVGLGDTITIRYPELGVNATARIVATKYNCLKERFDKLTVGSIKTDLATVITNTAQNSVQSVQPGTPVATVGAVTNHAVTVTPSVTNVTGFIQGGTRTGTAVTVSASDLVSGTKNITANGNNIDVTNYEKVNVAVPGGGGGTYETVSTSVTPSESTQTVTLTASSGYDAISTATVTVSAISSTYVGSGVTRRSSLSVSGATVTAQAGYYASAVSASVTSGSAGSPTITRTVSTANYYLAVTWPNATAGYYSSLPAATASLTLESLRLEPREFSQTFTPAGDSYYINEVIVDPIPGQYIVPTGNIAITANTTSIDVSQYATASVAVPTGTLQTVSTTVTPTESQQSITLTPSSGYTGIGTASITVTAITSTYVGSDVTRRSSGDLLVVGKSVLVPSGIYSIQAAAQVADGTAGTPTATKGTVSSNSVSVTPSVTNTTGYITGSTITGTPVTVTAAELVSGNLSLTANTTNADCTNYATVTVNVSGGGGGPTLLSTTSLGSLSTSSTSGTNTNKTLSLASSTGWANYDLLIVDISVDTETNGRHTSTVSMVLVTHQTSYGTPSNYTVVSNKWNSKKNSSGTGSTRQSTTAYGVYVNSVSVSNGTMSLPIYYKYNNNSTGTINGTYTARVYGVKLYDLIGG